MQPSSHHHQDQHHDRTAASRHYENRFQSLKYIPAPTAVNETFHGATSQPTVPVSRAFSPASSSIHLATSQGSREKTPPRLPALLGTLSTPAAPSSDAVSQSKSGNAPGTPGRLSVVLLPSPGNAREYSESTINSDLVATQTPSAQTPRLSTHSGRGRPKGWRPGMSYAAMRGNAPPDSASRPSRPSRPRPPPGSLTIKRRGRPPKAPSPPPADIFRRLKPAYLEFLCEWPGCKAELQNLETLRRHVLVVHIRLQSERHCLWGKCGSKMPQYQFHDESALVRHVEEAHMIPISWHVGDGPANSWNCLESRDSPNDQVPDFLRDSNGNQVTPSTRDQETEDLATYRLNRQKLKDLIMARDANLPSDDESESTGSEH